jgi:hypothetical protein
MFKGKKMKKIILGLLISTLIAISAQAYMIGGAYATLISCDWGQYGYEYGYIGTYRLIDGRIYQVYFGNHYCQY